MNTEKPKCQVLNCNNHAQLISSRAEGRYRKSKWVREQYNVSDGHVCSKCHHKKIVENNDGKIMDQILAENAGFKTIAEWRIAKAQELKDAQSAGYTNISDWREAKALQEANDAGHDTVEEWNQAKTLQMAKDLGFETIAEWRRSKELSTAKKEGFECITSWRNSKHPYLKYRKNYCENIDSRLGFKCEFKPPTARTLANIGLSPTFQGWLQVDHIDGNHLNNAEYNLQTMCANCHTIKTFMSGDYATPGRKTRIINENGEFDVKRVDIAS